MYARMSLGACRSVWGHYTFCLAHSSIQYLPYGSEGMYEKVVGKAPGKRQRLKIVVRLIQIFHDSAGIGKHPLGREAYSEYIVYIYTGILNIPVYNQVSNLVDI